MKDTIIQDYEFNEYPVVRTYPLGNKMVIQIGDSTRGEPKKVLLDKISDLEGDYEILQEEKKDTEKELEKAEKELNQIEEKHNEELDKIENSLESAEQFLGIETSERAIHRRIAEFARKIDERLQSEEVSGLEIDNRALCDTIEKQDQIILDLTEKLTKWETAYPHG